MTTATAGRRETRLPPGLRAEVFARSLLLQAGWNFERMQNLGFAFALDPWLRRAWTDPAERRRAVLRHLDFFNTKPYMAGFALGVIGALEEDLARQPPEERPRAEARMLQLKKLLGSCLAAIGDPLYWGALRPFCAAVALAALGLAVWAGAPAPWAWAGAAYLAAFNAAALAARWKGIELGYRWRERIAIELQGLPFQPAARLLRGLGLAIAAALAAAWLARPGSAAPTALFAACLALKAARVPNRFLYAGLLAAGVALGLAGAPEWSKGF